MAVGRREPREQHRRDEEDGRERAVGELLAREQALGAASERALEEALGTR